MSKKLHILFLCGWYPSRVLPTNGDFIQRHAKAVSLQHKVSVLHIISDVNLTKNIEICINEKGQIKEYIAYIRTSRNSLVKGYLFFKAYKSILKKIDDFDLVHVNKLYPFGIFALHQKWFFKKQFIVSEHWSGYHLPQVKKISFLEKTLSKIIAKSSFRICPVSNDLQNSMQNFGLIGNYKRVPNVVDTALFIPGKSSSKVFTIAHISNMVEVYKNVSGILRVLKKLQDFIPEFKIKFIGETSTELISKTEKLGINLSFCEFIEHLPHEQIITELQNADCLLLFSNYENLPCVILESFSVGTPVISTNVGGIREFFPDNFGTLINKGDEAMLLKKLICVSNKEIAFATPKDMHTYAVANFGKEKICEDFSELYFKALKNYS